MSDRKLFALIGLLGLILIAAGCKSANQAPTIHFTQEVIVEAGETVEIPVIVSDPEGNPVVCVWSATSGEVPPGILQCGAIEYTAPESPGMVVVSVTADDRNGNVVTGQLNVAVVVPPTPTPTPTPTLIPTPTDTPTPTTPPEPFVAITNPEITLDCENPAEEGFCKFSIEGIGYSGVTTEVLRIYTFVFPLDPHGSGWYRQLPATTIRSDGTWLQPINYLGGAEAPALEGHTLRIRAALVVPGATYFGTPLDKDDTLVLEIIEDIDGWIAISDEVLLTVGPRESATIDE